MELLAQIEQALKTAMKERDETRRDALRMLLTAIKVKEKEIKHLPDEVQIRQVISSQIKQRRDASEQFTQGGRKDLAEKEEAELRVLQGFLPEALSRDALEALVDEVIGEAGASGPKDMGRVMKALMPRLEGRADGKLVNEVVRSKLQP
ncbi:MAG: GatB/YqeY domain-containing protein [Syntrophobacteraceae bacterium]|nr:GatB/YqeY domain-containing protein [Desulfobacteraceae bacterium]